MTEVDARADTLWPHPLLADTGERTSREVPDHVDVLARTTSGAVVTADVVGGVAPDDATFRLDLRGTDGWLSLTGGTLFGVQGGDLMLSSSAAFEAPDEAGRVRRRRTGDQRRRALREAGRSDLRTGSRSAPGFAHAAHNARLIAAVAEAASSGRRVMVPSTLAR